MKVACFSYAAKIIKACVGIVTSLDLSSSVCAFPSSSNEYIHSHSHREASSYSLSNSLLVLAVRMILDEGLTDLFVLTRFMGTA